MICERETLAARVSRVARLHSNFHSTLRSANCRRSIMFPRELGSGASSDSPAARLSSEFSLPSPILPQSNPNTFHPRNVSRETTAAGAAATSSRSRRQQRAGAQIPIPSSLASGRNQSHEDGDGDGDEDATSEDDTTFLCLYYTRGKLGAALYSLDSASLALLPTVSDMGPDFKVAKALLYQVCDLSGLMVEFPCLPVDIYCTYCTDGSPPRLDLLESAEAVR